MSSTILAQSDDRTAEVELALPTYFETTKRILDRLLAVLLLVPGLPLMGALIALVRLTSPGPGVFAQQRTGRGGREFTMYKLRSMRSDAEAKSGAVWCSKNDPRVTRVGWWLRRLHLDELPQLFNVLKGEMSLVGPRPERPEFVDVLAEQIPGYRDRLAILPGVTGLAQINLPPDTDITSVRRKQVLDLEYVRTASLWMDLRMIACSFLRLAGIKGDVAMRLMSLQRSVELSDIYDHGPAEDDIVTGDDSCNGLEDVADVLSPELLTRAREALSETISWDTDDTAETLRREIDKARSELAGDASHPQQPR